MSYTQGRAYTIKPGETLFIIAQRELKKGNRWCEIMKPNGRPFTQAEAYNLQVGQKIYLPKSESTPPQPCETYPARLQNHREIWGVSIENNIKCDRLTCT